MFVQRSVLFLLVAAVPLAQADSATPRPGYLGLQLGHSGIQLTCGRPAFACERAWATGNVPGTQLSLVGRTRFGESVGLEGRVGTRFGPADTTVMGASAPLADRSQGLAYGAGLRWHFSRRGSATFGLDSYEQPLAGGGRETVRAATLGLQWHY